MSSEPESPASDAGNAAQPRHETDQGLSSSTPGSAKRRPSNLRRQLVIGALLALLGFAAATQIRSTHRPDSLAQQPRENLVTLLDSLSAAADRVQVQITQLQHTRDQLLNSSRRHRTALIVAHHRLNELQLLAGTVAARGPGVRISIADPRSAVTAAVLLDGIEELRDAGAEAIEINNQVRVVASTAFLEKSGVLVDGHLLRPPYTIDVIGPSHTLSQAVVFPGGLQDQVSSLGGTVTVRQEDKVLVSSLHRIHPPEYAQPTGG
jgi:uncharacterized protein YlxW (UPF0749 family)